ncbi:MAG TPA: hypothetical protein VGD69_01505 [Herpetosiphonaceae bacterium]
MNIRWLYPLLCLMLIFGTGHASAQQQAISWDITVGFDGSFKAENWFPVVVTISNSGPDVNATLSVAFRGASTAYRQPVDLPSGANKRLVVPVISGSDNFGNTRLDVTLRDGTRVIRTESVMAKPIGIGWNVIGVISNEDGALAELSTFEERNASPTSLVRLKGTELPDRVEMLQALDALFVQAVDTTAWTEQQRQVLRAWIDSGGQLIVGGDERMTRGLADLLPAAVAGAGSPSNLQGLKAAGWALRDNERQVPLLQLAPADGARVVATGEGGQPLIVRRAFGAGSIIQTAFDLQVLRDVGNPVGLWVSLLSLNQEQMSLSESLRNQGFSILRESLRLPQLSFLSALGLFGFLSLYILIVGPINYLILRRFNRREWAYLTIPLWVVVFSIGAYAWGTLGRGSSTLINQLAIVLVPQEAEQGKALTYVSLFSPTRSTYNLGFPSNALVSDGANQWERIPEDFDVVYAEGGVEVPDLSVDVGGISLLAVEQPVAAPKVSATIREVNGQQQMTLRNLSDRRLVDIVLFRGDGQVQEIDVLEPGADRTVVLNPDHSFYDFLQISDGETVQRQAVIRQMGSVLQPKGFGEFMAPGMGVAEPAVPAAAYPPPPQLDPVEVITPTFTPTPGGPTGTPGPQLPTGTAILPTPTALAAEQVVPTMAPAAPAPDMPQPVPAPQVDAQQVWYVLAWEAKAPVEMQLNGSPAEVAGESLYVWTAQKEQ